MAWAACGKASPTPTAAALMVRCSWRPWPRLCWREATGMCRQGRFLTWAYRPGWFLLDHQDVMGPLTGDKELGVLALGVQGVGGDDAPGQVQRLEQRREPGDLTRKCPPPSWASPPRSMTAKTPPRSAPAADPRPWPPCATWPSAS